MNPLTNVKNIQKLNQQELKLGGKKSWHDQYKDSAWVFIGGLPYDLTEGDIVCVFSQYGEVVNINLVRDDKSGKSKGYAFLCYEDQRSTILAVDNLNSVKLLGRIIRVDHVENYRKPKDKEEEDEITKKLKAEGCAPAVSMATIEKEEKDEVPLKKIKKETNADHAEKKTRKKKKKKKDKKKLTSNRSDSDSDETRGKQKIKKEKHDRGYDKAEFPEQSVSDKQGRQSEYKRDDGHTAKYSSEPKTDIKLNRDKERDDDRKNDRYKERNHNKNQEKGNNERGRIWDNERDIRNRDRSSEERKVTRLKDERDIRNSDRSEERRDSRIRVNERDSRNRELSEERRDSRIRDNERDIRNRDLSEERKDTRRDDQYRHRQKDREYDRHRNRERR